MTKLITAALPFSPFASQFIDLLAFPVAPFERTSNYYFLKILYGGFIIFALKFENQLAMAIFACDYTDAARQGLGQNFFTFASKLRPLQV